MSVDAQIDRFYDALVREYGLECMENRRRSLCLDATYQEWKEYCFSLESPF